MALITMNKLFNSILIAILSILSAGARDSFDANRAGGQYFAYPVPKYGVPALSPAPEGYEPFHLEHYGRHGSRWNLGAKDFAGAIDILEKARKKNILTPRGEQLLSQLRKMAADSGGKVGEMTPLGHCQHREIASRMATNFPELFSGKAYLDAKSTESNRCILSMNEEVGQLQKTFPDLKVKKGSPANYQEILNYNNKDLVAIRLAEEAKPLAADFRKSLPSPDSFFNKLFTDRKFVKEVLGEENVFKSIFELAINVQSHDGSYAEFFDIFTPEEIENEWKSRNAEWYVRFGNTPITKNRTPFNQRVLLKNMIESADTAMLSANSSVNLRFGHDLILMPLCVLMELDNAGYETTDLSTLADNWRNYQFFPMAGNIQMIFYRPKNGKYSVDDILVKVLLQEAEASLPVKPVSGNYYRWSDLRNYYLNKLQNMPDIK